MKGEDVCLYLKVEFQVTTWRRRASLESDEDKEERRLNQSEDDNYYLHFLLFLYYKNTGSGKIHFSQLTHFIACQGNYSQTQSSVTFAYSTGVIIKLILNFQIFFFI